MNRSLLRSFGWLFAALSMASLLFQPGSVQNEWSHAAGIWCGHGVRDYYCSEVRTSADGDRSVVTNIVDQECWAKQTAPLLCPEARGEQVMRRTNEGAHPSLFSFALSWLTVGTIDMSILLVRLANAFLLSAVLVMLTALLPGHYLQILALLIMAVFTAPGGFLLLSVNPLSWATLGIGLGWLPLHASMAPSSTGIVKRRTLAAIGVFLLVLGIGSDRSTFGFSIVVVICVGTHPAWLNFPSLRRLLLGVSAGSIGVLLVAMEWFPPGMSYTLRIARPEASRLIPDVVEGSSFNYLRDLLPVIPNAARSLFGFPSWNPVNPLLLTVAMPEIVTIGSIALLGYLLVRSSNLQQKFQLGGAILVLVLASLVSFTQVSLQDKNEYITTDALVIYPPLVFAVGWWFYFSPDVRSVNLLSSLRSVALVSTALFSLSVFTVAERFVDRQSLGLRYIPEGLDQWWWPWMPVGPNVIVVLAVIFLWKFFSTYIPTILSRRNSLRQQ